MWIGVSGSGQSGAGSLYQRTRTSSLDLEQLSIAYELQEPEAGSPSTTALVPSLSTVCALA